MRDEKKELISIIVPVYNAEGTLKRCINSIRNQSYENIELILINDGSKDNSLGICEELYEQDKRIKVISKENSGVSDARNLGIEIANGKYIGFVDSDDWIDQDMYSSMYRYIDKNHAELVLCNYTEVYGERHVKRDEFIGITDDTDQIKEVVLSRILCSSDRNIMGSCCRMLVSKELLIKNNINFPIGMKMSEDMMFVIKCVDSASRIYLDRRQLNYFYINENSTTSKYMQNIWEDMMTLFHWCNNNILVKYSSIGLDEGIKECTINAVITAIRNVCKRGTPLNIWQRMKYSKNFYKDPFINNAIRTTWMSREKFNKKVWPQIICLALKCNWLVVLYHSLKNRTLLTK